MYVIVQGAPFIYMDCFSILHTVLCTDYTKCILIINYIISNSKLLVVPFGGNYKLGSNLGSRNSSLVGDSVAS